MNKRLKNIITILIGLGIGVFLMWYLYGDKDSDELWGYLSKVNPWWIAASWLLGYAAIVSRGFRWKTLLKPLGHEPNTWNSVNAVSFSYLSNSAIPRSGEVARCAAMNQTDGVPVDHLLGTVITERVVDFVMLFLFMAIALFGNTEEFMKMWDEATIPESAKTVIVISFIAMAICVLLLILLRKKLAQINFIKVKVIPFLLGLRDGLKTVFLMKQKGWFVAHTLFIWACYYLMAYVIFLGSPGLENTPVLTVLVIMIAGGWGMVFPSPNGLGSYHGATIAAFVVIGLAEEAGKSYAFAVWIIQASMICLTGMIGLIGIMLARSKKKEALEQA